ncbi:MAG: polysaccharide deacetylase family protein, partial [Pseudobutyrivibrio sp.]|nr:polysaccharide deacetylase family protein [Pseudobutyrivibrio sp.]
SNVDAAVLKDFVINKKSLKEGRPGILVTFDDGFDNNFEVAAPVLDRFGVTGYFFVSSDLVGSEGYMTWEQLADLKNRGHVIGCHTATHHRMEKDDTEAILNHEITEAKAIISEHLGDCDIFCWCGGEEEHYTKAAAKKIKESGFTFSFMTCSNPITKDSNPLQLQRSNVEAGWSNSLMRFQISGLMDRRFDEKRMRVEALTNTEE